MVQPIRNRKAVYLTNVDDHSDNYAGTKKADLIYGFRGDDILSGLGGNDVIKGGLGHDLIYGGSGADRLLGEWGDDFIFGGTGDDVMTGGDGADTFRFAAGAGVDRISDYQAGLDLLSFLAEETTGMVEAIVNRIRLSANQLHSVVEWSVAGAAHRIVLTNVQDGLSQADFENFTLSDQALNWLA
jgi:Ca2+-binding RTX toxin-like protein